MGVEILILGGYGQFVWPAFIFTFVSCFVLYARTKREFKKHEKIFSREFEQSQIKTTRQKEALSGSTIF